MTGSPLEHEQDKEIAVASKGNGKTHTRLCLTCQNTFDGELSHCPHDSSPLVGLENDPLIGKMLGQYRIISLIGQGGMGVVYKAEQIILQRIVALKVIRTGAKDSGALLRFQQEGKAVSTLSHPNIVTVYDLLVTDEGVPYLAMEYLDGKTLAEIDGDLNLEQKVDIFIQLCGALGHAHGKGVIHRDLKPGNIVFSDWNPQENEVHVKILDFGIAKLLPSSGKQFLELTRTGQPIGSPAYMSPEQCRAEELDPRSDIYSLGCVMYKVFTGEPMFESESLFKIIGQQMTETPPPFSKVCPEARIPVELEEIVFKALEKNKDRRYQTMGELQQALVKFKAGNTSAMQILSARMKRMIRYRPVAYTYLGLIVSPVLIWVGVSFASLLWEHEARNVQADLHQAVALGDQAREKQAAGDLNSAQILLEKALKVEKPLPNEPDCNLTRASTLQTLGGVYLQLDSNHEAESKFEQAYKLFSENQAGKEKLVSIMQDLAEAKKRLSKFDEALNIVRDTRVLAQGMDGPLANCLLHEATIKENLRELRSAEHSYLEALKAFENLHEDRSPFCIPVYQGLARIARDFHDKAKEDQWNAREKECSRPGG